MVVRGGACLNPTLIKLNRPNLDRTAVRGGGARPPSRRRGVRVQRASVQCVAAPQPPARVHPTAHPLARTSPTTSKVSSGVRRNVEALLTLGASRGQPVRRSATAIAMACSEQVVTVLAVRDVTKPINNQ